jgi:hypothetical protein
VAVDAATLENGCLEMATGRYWNPTDVPLTPHGTVQPDFEMTINFVPVTCKYRAVALAWLFIGCGVTCGVFAYLQARPGK